MIEKNADYFNTLYTKVNEGKYNKEELNEYISYMRFIETGEYEQAEKDFNTIVDNVISELKSMDSRMSEYYYNVPNMWIAYCWMQRGGLGSEYSILENYINALIETKITDYTMSVPQKSIDEFISNNKFYDEYFLGYEYTDKTLMNRKNYREMYYSNNEQYVQLLKFCIRQKACSTLVKARYSIPTLDHHLFWLYKASKEELDHIRRYGDDESVLYRLETNTLFDKNVEERDIDNCKEYEDYSENELNAYNEIIGRAVDKCAKVFFFNIETHLLRALAYRAKYLLNKSRFTLPGLIDKSYDLKQDRESLETVIKDYLIQEIFLFSVLGRTNLYDEYPSQDEK